MNKEELIAWQEELVKKYEPFKKFEELEKKRRAWFHKRWKALPDESYEQYHKRVSADPQYDIDCKKDQMRWYKNMSIFNGIKLWDGLDDEFKDRYYRKDCKVEKWQLIADWKHILDDEWQSFNRAYADWHFTECGWVAFG